MKKIDYQKQVICHIRGMILDIVIIIFASESSNIVIIIFFGGKLPTILV